MSGKLIDPNQPAGAIVEMYEDGSALRNDGGKLQPANKNKWYVLATVFGELKDNTPDKTLHARNRRIWNGWMCQDMSAEERRALAEKMKLGPNQLDELTDDELAALKEAFKLRLPGVVLPGVGETINLSETYFSYRVEWQKFVFNGHAEFKSTAFGEYANFDYAVYRKEAYFGSATFSRPASFMHTTFSENAIFGSATFSEDAYFWSAVFNGPADFMGVSFYGAAIFKLTTFNLDANFASVSFSRSADFLSATFNSPLYFHCSTFSGDTNFKSATFRWFAGFNSVTFSGPVKFISATFNDRATFNSTTFSGPAYFTSATFSGPVDFRSVPFKNTAGFIATIFRDYVAFKSATFNGLADFSDGTFEAKTNFRETKFKGTAPKFLHRDMHQDTIFTAEDEYWPDVTKQNAEDGIQAYTRLRQFMSELYKPDDEHFFFRQEMRCKAKQGKWWQNLEIKGFGFFSNYGYSIGRPLAGLALVVSFGWPPIGSFLMYCVNVKGVAPIFEGMGISIGNTLPFLGIVGKMHPDFYTQAPAWLDLLSGVQSVLGIVLLFFLGLGLRNRFRLR